MTYGSSQSRCESNVHTWVKPCSSACLASSIDPRGRRVGLQHDTEVHVRSPQSAGTGQPAPDEPAVAGASPRLPSDTTTDPRERTVSTAPSISKPSQAE